MKTILHILNTGGISGAENVVMSICSHLQDEYRMVYVSPDGVIREALGEKKIEFESITAVTRGEMARVIRKLRPDLIHAHDFTASMIAAFSSSGLPVISHIHNNSPWLKSVNARTVSYGAACLRFRKMLGVSASVFDDFVFGKRFLKKEMIIGNPVDVQAIREQAAAAEDRNGYDVVYLGRLSEAKDPLRFLRIMKAVAEKIPGVRAAMVGDGELREEVEKVRLELGLEKTVEMVGFRSNPYGILSASKVMCMPSKWEGYGLAAVEALACGLPVVCSAAGGLPGIVTEDAGKICTEDGAFAEGIVSMLTDESRRQQKSAAALARADALDNMDQYLEELRKVYTEILGTDAK